MAKDRTKEVGELIQLVAKLFTKQNLKQLMMSYKTDVIRFFGF
jgi:hypothetical protein